MNSNAHLNDELGSLAPYVEAVLDREPTEIESGRARQRLLRRLEATAGTGSASAPRLGWRWAAAAAVLAVVATTLVPFMPGGRDGVAFADVQRRFETFETMHVSMTTEVNGQRAMATDVVMDDEGRTRLDAGELFSYVIDPRAGVMLQLFHQPKRAMTIPLGSSGAVPDEARLGWLEEIRSFEGQAERLRGERTIEGRRVTGFHLESGGMEMKLWATPEGEPVRLEIRQGGDDRTLAVTRMDFRFDRTVEADRFDLEPPAGYTRMQADPDAR